jgi:hypothetical protein
MLQAQLSHSSVSCQRKSVSWFGINHYQVPRIIYLQHGRKLSLLIQISKSPGVSSDYRIRLPELAVAERLYTKAFGSWHSFPDPWFDFEVDTLYLDCGWLDERQYSVDDFGDDAMKLKHLAVHETEVDHRRRKSEDHEDFLCGILVDFCRLETLTPVNRRHKTYDNSSDLVFMEPVNLLLW